MACQNVPLFPGASIRPSRSQQESFQHVPHWPWLPSLVIPPVSSLWHTDISQVAWTFWELSIFPCYGVPLALACSEAR